MTLNKDEKIISMKTKDLPITLNTFYNKFSYYNSSKFDANLLNTNKWHMILIHHKNKYSKQQILDAFFQIVENDDFYPVAYRNGHLCDKFFIRNCRNAIQKLFSKNLTLEMPMGDILNITFKFNAADYETGQIYPAKKIEKAIEMLYENLETIEGVTDVLNLDNFSTHSELADIVVNLGNEAAFDLLLKLIAQNHDICNGINGLKLSNNKISSLAPFNKHFIDYSLRLLDLRKNNLTNIKQFKALKNIKIQDLYVTDNPLTSDCLYQQKIKNILPNVIKLDETHHSKEKSNKLDITVFNIQSSSKGHLIESNIGESFNKYETSKQWHQISVIHNGKYTKTQILDAIFNICDLYPCYYETGANEDTFLVRNSFHQMQVLLQNNMNIKIPGTNRKLKIIFRMDVAKFSKGQAEPKELIMLELTERFDAVNHILNLENFCESKTLNCVSLSFGNSDILDFVLTQCGQRYAGNVFELRLNSNRILSGAGFTSLNTMKNIKSLDLTNNLLKSIDDLKNIPKSLQEITLNGNPLCDKYDFSDDYIRDVKEIFPQLNKLDGVKLADDDLGFITYKNYLQSLDLYDFVQQFIMLYFKFYDSPQRKMLASDLYANESVFSLSFYYDASKIHDGIRLRLNKYINRSKNIKKLTDLNRAYTSLHHGKNDIGDVFKQLPLTLHDYLSFTTDVTKLTDNLISITICGVFQDQAPNFAENDIFFSFSRTFILTSTNKNQGVSKISTEYEIINDILYISNPTEVQIKNTCRFSNYEDDATIDANETSDKESFTVIFQDMTNLKTTWCTRYLEKAKWNFKQALHFYMGDITNNQIPEDAFRED